jgi:hypothetical protein
MSDIFPVGAGTKRLLGKQPSHQKSATLFWTFVAETSQQKGIKSDH